MPVPSIWEYRKYSSLDGDTVVEFKKGEQLIEARSRGIDMKNIQLESYGEMQDFAKALSDAWQKHEALRRVVLDRLMGKG